MFLHNNKNIIGRYITYLWLLIAMLIASPLFAQTSPLSDQEYQRQREQEQLRRDKMKEDAPFVHLPEKTSPLSPIYPTSETPCRVIRTITFVGDGASLWGSLLPLVADAKNRCLGTRGINVVVSQIQNALIREGYVTSRALIAPQDLSSGKLEVTILMGRIGKIAMAESSREGAILGSAFPMVSGDVLNIRDVEQALENLRRVPTVAADIKIAPGTHENESDLIVDWAQSFPLRLNLAVDDSGSKATGKYQGNATLSIDNPLGQSDLFYVGLSRSLTHHQPYGTKGGNIYYSIPFGRNQISISANQHNYHQTVAGYQTDYVYSGDSTNVNLTYQRILYRTGTSKTTGSVGLYTAKSHNFIDGEQIDVQRRRTGGWEAGLSHEQQIEGAKWDIDIKVKRGTRLMEAMPAPEEAFEDEGTPKAMIVTTNHRLVIPFYERFRYVAQIRAQGVLYKNPLARDRFSIGGRYTVRGFDGELTLSADNGYIIKNDISTSFDVLGTRHELYAGVDIGHVWGQGDQYLLGRTLSGAAQGIRGQIKHFNYEFFIGEPIKKPEHFKASRLVAGFNASVAF
jgi:hemolysin activation/secretion protein